MRDRWVSVSWLSTAGALVFALVTTLVGESQGAPTRFLLLDGAGGLLFIVSGLAVWSARPDLRTGPLLLGSAMLWFVGSYAPTTLMPASLLGFAFERYYDVVLAFLVLTFPRAPLRGARAVVLGVLAGAFLLRTAARLLVGCTCTGENPFALGTDDRLFDRSQLVTSWVVVGAAVAVAVLAMNRLITSSRVAKRYLAPVVLSGSVAALVAAYDALELAWFVQTGDLLVDLGEPGNEILAWSVIAAVGLVPLGFLVGALQRPGTQGAIAQMAVDLDRGTDPEQLRDALRHALGDPTLQLYLGDVGLADLGVQTGRVSTVLEGDHGPMAVLTHDPILREDPGLVAAAVAVLRLAVENERLGQVVRDQLEEVRASRTRLIEAAEDERRRIVRDLHDGAQQRLIAVALSLQQVREATRRIDPGSLHAHLVEDAMTDLVGAVDELRRLARGIHPAILTEEGLLPAVAGLARRSPVPVNVEVETGGRLPPVVEATAYFIVAEALTNVVRHSDARSAVVHIARSGGLLDVEVHDDGAGGAEGSRGSGLQGMADRLDALAGSLVVDSPVGGGTWLKATIPCA
jgi:signal transduction histidine kinase